jgi:hypothetical protein
MNTQDRFVVVGRWTLRLSSVMGWGAAFRKDQTRILLLSGSSVLVDMPVDQVTEIFRTAICQPRFTDEGTLP